MLTMQRYSSEMSDKDEELFGTFNSAYKCYNYNVLISFYKNTVYVVIFVTVKYCNTYFFFHCLIFKK